MDKEYKLNFLRYLWCSVSMFGFISELDMSGVLSEITKIADSYKCQIDDSSISDKDREKASQSDRENGKSGSVENVADGFVSDDDFDINENVESVDISEESEEKEAIF